MELEKINLSWRVIDSLCNKIVVKLKEKIPNILDYNVVGLSRGGLIPAVIISNLLNIRKVYSLGLKSYKNQQQEEVEIYQVPELSKMDKILLVDDISDSGNSFKNSKEMMSTKKVITASLTIKPKTNFMPDVYGKLIKKDAWIVFPWE